MSGDVEAFDGWDHRHDGLWSRRVGPLVLEVEQWRTDRPLLWSWRFGIAGTRDSYAHAIERSGRMIDDLMAVDDAKAACLAAARAFGQSIVEGAVERLELEAGSSS